MLRVWDTTCFRVWDTTWRSTRNQSVILYDRWYKKR